MLEIARRRRLLLVEDDALVRETIALMLEEVFEVVASERTSIALGLLHDPESPPPAVILLDCLLPEGPPDELLAEADIRHIPVVLISGDPRQLDRQPERRLFLGKPFGRDTMLAAIEAALRGGPLD